MNRAQERGSVSTWLVTMVGVMALCVGLAVDLGGQVHAQQRAFDLAAQAARTAGQQVTAADAIQGDALNVDAWAAIGAAETYLAAAGVEGTATVSGPTITVNVADTYRPVVLGALLGNIEVQASASARIVRTVGGVEQ